MKNIKTLFSVAIIGAAALSMTSCDNDEYLIATNYEATSPEDAFKSDETAKAYLTGVYVMMRPDFDGDHGGGGDWGFKPNLFTGCHPTMDTQATGWDKDWNQQQWNAGSSELLGGWKHAYMAIGRANEFIANIEKADKSTLSSGLADKLEGEAFALHGFFSHWLATTFRKIPVLEPGENYLNTPVKSNDISDADLWDKIISDFQNAADRLDWAPLDGEYGRATKGMALAYLADCYMWKAYRCPEQAQDCYTKAKAALKQVIDSKTYELNKSFTTLWDCAGAWDKECIWAEVLNEGTKWGSFDKNERTGSMFTKFYAACPENGGWGSLFLSWEWYASYEKGDRRRDGSCVTGAVPVADMEKYGIEKSAYVYGVNPYLCENIGAAKDSKTKQFHFYNGEYAPSIWSTKFWRNAKADWSSVWSPTNIYWKRYANVLIDYAECCFALEGDDSAEGWAMLDQIRDRAFGKLEVGNAQTLTDKYLAPINQLLSNYGLATIKEYPIPFATEVAPHESAKEYYTKLAASGPTWLGADAKPFHSKPWKVAVNMERRKEFNCEWCLRPDMQRSGFMKEHIEINYPKRNEDNLTNIPWSNRKFDYSDDKMDMPIPTDEMIKNTALVQNPAYLKNE